jgi:hypothetical protein
MSTKSNKESEVRAERPKLELVGQDGNAFNVLGLAKRAAQKAGWQKEQFDVFLQKAISGDYDHLLQTVMEHFDVT